MKQRVRIEIKDDGLSILYLPENVEVEVIDYEVEGLDPDELDRYEGELCRHWVENETGAPANCEYDSEEGWENWLKGQANPPRGEVS